MQEKTKKGLIATSATIIVLLVGVLADAFDVLNGIKTYLGKSDRDINVGILHTLKSEEFRDSLEKKYIVPANKRLSDLNIDKKFKLVDVTYTGMFQDLQNQKIDIAFSSPYTYLAYNKKKIPQIEQMNVRAIRRQIFTGDSYYSYLIFNKNTNTKPDNQNLIKENLEQGKFKIFVGNRWSSTSTRVFPNIFFWEKGFILEKNMIGYEREQMLDSIISAPANKCYIGFLSSSDFFSLPKGVTGKLENYAIEIPIPSDPILINANNFNQKFGENAENILNAISGAEMAEKTEEWNFPVFEEYVATGVVYKIIDNIGYIIFPNGKNDLLDNLFNT